MTTTARYGITDMVAAQSSPEVVYNAAVDLLDALVGGELQARSQAAPPGSPNEGEIWHIGTGTGDFSGQDGDLAIYLGGGWVYVTPPTGTALFDATTGAPVWWDGTQWVDSAGTAI